MSTESVVFCHDFQNASCQRINCRFLHYSLQEEEYYRTYNILPSSEPKTSKIFCNDMAAYGQCCHSEACQKNSSENNLKRSSIDSRYDQQNSKRYRDQSDEFDILTVIRRMDDEQKNLRHRIESNEIKIANLYATNEYLMQQNAQIRQCTHTITNTASAPHVLGTVSIAPVQVQAPPSIVTMAAQQPISITANTSQGQLALSQQTLTTAQCPLGQGHSSQILSTSQITLAPALAPAPTIGLTINTSQALALSNSLTQPIISYPVMTHSILPH